MKPHSRCPSLVTRAFLLLLFLIAFLFVTVPASAQRFIPLGPDSAIDVNGIPFSEDGASMEVEHTDDFTPSERISLAGMVVDKIHILQSSAFALSVPNGVNVGRIKAVYQDATATVLELVMGVNTAEWAYDRPDSGCCLAHNKVPPAHSEPDVDYYGTTYLGHLFYVSMDTEAKPLDYIELELDASAYTHQPDCPAHCEYHGSGLENWFRIHVEGITVEVEGTHSGLPVRDKVSINDACGPETRGQQLPAVWGEFGLRPALEFNSGETLWIRCAPTDATHQSLHMYYSPPPGQTLNCPPDATYAEGCRVGVCQYGSGCNEIWFSHTGNQVNDAGDPIPDHKPDYLLKTNWLSYDFGKDDDTDNRLDMFYSYFDGYTQMLTKQVVEFDYLWGPPIGQPGEVKNLCDTHGGLLGSPVGSLIDVQIVDPPLGPETEAYFDQLLEQTLNTLPAAGDMYPGNSMDCDLNDDGACDDLDLTQFRTAVGACLGDARYLPQLDVHYEGCINVLDEYHLFYQDRDRDTAPDVIDNCLTFFNPDQLDEDQDGVGNLCDNCPKTGNRDQSDTNGTGAGDACVCRFDTDGDGDIDGQSVAELASSDFDIMDLGVLSATFGTEVCTH